MKYLLRINLQVRSILKNNCVPLYRTYLYHKTVCTHEMKCELCHRSSRIRDSGKQNESVKTKITLKGRISVTLTQNTVTIKYL